MSKEEAEWPGVISADGKTVAYGWIAKDGFDLRTIPVQGGKPRVLVHDPEIVEVEPCAWTSDGAQIVAVIRRKDKNNQIALVSTSDGSLRILKSLQWRYPKKVSLSPDNRYIVYDAPTRRESPQTDIFILATDGSKESALVEHPTDDYGPVWTPDGRNVVFMSNRGGTVGLWTITVPGGKPDSEAKLVKADLGRAVQGRGTGQRPLGFSRDGTYYYGFRNFTSDIYMAEWDAETGRLQHGPSSLSERYVGSNLNPMVSPDGKYLAYLSSRDSGDAASRVVTVVRSLESGKEQDFPGAVGQRWFPDSRSLLIIREKQGRRSLSRMEPATGEVTSLLELRSDQVIRKPVISHDGKTLYFLARSRDHREPALVARDLVSGNERRLAPSLALNIRGELEISPDGSQMAVLTADANGKFLAVLPLGGGEPRELIRDARIQEKAGLAWTPDGRYLLYNTSPSRGRSEMWRVTVDSGELQKIDMPLGEVRSLSMHSDGRRLILGGGSAGIGNWEIWAVENFLPTLKANK